MQLGILVFLEVLETTFRGTVKTHMMNSVSIYVKFLHRSAPLNTACFLSKYFYPNFQLAAHPHPLVKSLYEPERF